MDLQKVLDRHQVDRHRGFLPGHDPVQQLPAPFSLWSASTNHLSNNPIALRDAVAEFPELDPTPLLQEPGLTRAAMLFLSVLGSGYVHASPETVDRIPSSLAVPWSRIARALERPMIISHASIVLDNWSLVPGGDLRRPETLQTLTRFAGGADEDWFYLVTVAIEAEGATVLPTLIQTRLEIERSDDRGLRRCFDQLTQTLEAMRMLLNRMRERCRPQVFYDRIRPYLSGWPEPGIIYDGVNDTPQPLSGGSAAQSSLLQTIDAALGISHDDERSGPFLRSMRHYMPPAHRTLLEWLESGPSLRRAAERSGASSGFDTVIEALDRFRRDHLAITAEYITLPGTAHARGTGGTAYGTFLRVTRSETTHQRLD